MGNVIIFLLVILAKLQSQQAPFIPIPESIIRHRQRWVRERPSRDESIDVWRRCVEETQLEKEGDSGVSANT